MRRVVCTFANYPLSKGFERYRKEAEDMGVFDEIYTYDENDLPTEFRKKFGRFLYPYSRGYGYWGWKPFIIKQTYEKLQERDILLYTDLGCTLNKEGLKRLQEYFEKVNSNEAGILAARTQEVSKDHRVELKFYEYEWTKGDILDHFGIRDNKEYTHTLQFEAGIIFIRKNPVATKFIEEWVNTINDHFDFITDRPSKCPCMEGFKENRHDQSVFSIMAKKYKIADFSRNELCPNEHDNLDWSIMKDYPIWAKREVYYKSMWHYQHRFALRRLYDRIWAIKYFFKSLICPKRYYR